MSMTEAVMENSPLNLAHQQHRQAETHLRYRRFEEAIECHQQAANLLDHAYKLTSVPRAQESIKLQRAFHIRQIDVVKSQKYQFENYKKAVENQRQRIANTYANYELINKRDDKKGLQVAIYKTMNEADSLLDLLIRRGTGSDTDSLKSTESGDWDDKTIPSDITQLTDGSHIVGIKRPKDDQTVIEELRTLNQQLHKLVYELVMQIDLSAQETETLREKIKLLEAERERHHRTVTNAEPVLSQQNNLRVMTDSSGGNSSPFVFSPCTELSPEAIEARELPALAPLELPNFDFTTFTHKPTESTK